MGDQLIASALGGNLTKQTLNLTIIAVVILSLFLPKNGLCTSDINLGARYGGAVALIATSYIPRFTSAFFLFDDIHCDEDCDSMSEDLKDRAIGAPMLIFGKTMYATGWGLIAGTRTRKKLNLLQSHTAQLNFVEKAKQKSDKLLVAGIAFSLASMITS